MSLYSSIAKNTIIQIIGKAAGVFFSLLTVAMMTRYLGQTGFGYYITIFAFLQVFGILVDFGLQTTTVNLISEPNVDESKMMSNILTLRLLLSFVFLGLAPLVAMFFPYPPIIKTGIAISAFFFVFVSLSSVITGIFQKYLKMVYVALADFFGKAVLFVFIALIIYFRTDFNSILIATVVSSILQFILLFLYSKKFIQPRLTFDITVIKKIIVTTYPIAITIALNLVYFKSDIIILSLFRSPAEVGVYGVPYKLLEVFINLTYLFLGMLLPIMVNSYKSNDNKKLQGITQHGFNIISILSIPMIFGTFILGRPIMTMMAGPDFSVSGDILKILILATVTIFYASLFGYVIIAAGKQKQMIKFYLVNAAVSLVLYFMLIPRYGYWAASWLTVFTEIFILVTAFIVMKRYVNFSPNLRVFFKACVASVAMSIPVYAMKSLNIFMVVSIGVAVYFTVMYFIKGLKNNYIK